MKTVRIRLIAGSICALFALMCVSLMVAKPIKGAGAISDCNTALGKCILRCEGWDRCEDQCLKYWNSCMDEAGAPKENRRNPLKRREIDAGRAPGIETTKDATPTPSKIRPGEKGGVTTKPLTGAALPSPTATPKIGDSRPRPANPFVRQAKPRATVSPKELAASVQATIEVLASTCP